MTNVNDKPEVEDVKLDSDSKDKQVEKQQKVDFTKRLTKIILITAGLYFLWYIISDRYTPITDQARVRAFVIPIVPQVSGKISKIHIGGDKKVNAGDLLFEIDPRDYELALEQAKYDLELAGQTVGADTASVSAAKAKLAKAETNFNTKQLNANRIFAIQDKGAISQLDIDRTRGALDEAEQEVITAEAAYEQATQLLGDKGKNNPKILKALATLASAQLNLTRTKVRAPSDGVISYAKVNVGYYAAKGQVIMTFISTDYVWIEASYKENNLGNMKKGDPVDIVLDSMPGNFYPGSVVSIGYGVSFDKSVPGQLPEPQKPQGWMRDPQRFTVIIKIEEINAKNIFREGGQADVITYTGDSWILNSLGKISIWLTSYLSYIY